MNRLKQLLVIFRVKILSRYIWLACLVLPSLISAETVYKSVDEGGNVIFSDKASDGAEKIQIKKSPAVEFRQILPIKSPAAPEQESKKYYQALSILQPADDETVHSNPGSVTVTLSVIPTLKPGHMLSLEMDGKQLAHSNNTQFTLKNIDRGAHDIQVTLLDEAGKPLLTSDPSTFYMRRGSKLTGPLSVGKQEGTTPLNPPKVLPEGVAPTPGNPAQPALPASRRSL